MFNDKFVRIESEDGEQSKTFNDKNVAWFHDRNFKYKTNPELADDYWLNVEDQHFMVWSTMTSRSDWRKLYGQVDTVLRAGVPYTIYIEDKFDAPKIGSQKFIYFTELGPFGGKNYFLPYFFLGMAAVVLMIIIIFYIFFCCKLRNVDTSTDEYLATLSY